MRWIPHLFGNNFGTSSSASAQHTIDPTLDGVKARGNRTLRSHIDSAWYGKHPWREIHASVNMYARLQTVLSTALLLPLANIVATSPDTFQQRCLAFQPEEFVENARLNVREYVAAGTNLTFPDNDASCSRANQVVAVDLCRIALQITTSPTSRITFEAWLPEDWSGRFLATGNGGVDGCT